MTTQLLRELVSEYFSGQEWSLTFEVGNGTGAGVRRHADAVAMNLWPSRGLALHGIEIKASRSDWQRELNDPAKAEEIHRHCDCWWLVAAHGVVKDINEIPPGWGFMEMGKVDPLSEDGKRPRLRLKRQATKLERPHAVDRGFVAAILRAQQRAEGVEHSRAVQKAVESTVERRVENIMASRKQENSEAVERLKKLTAACGEVGLRWVGDDEICRAVAFVLKSGAASSYHGIVGLIQSFESAEASARHAASDLREAAVAAGIPLKEEPEQAALLLRRRA